MLDGLLLNYVWAIDMYPLLITLESLSLTLLVIAWIRRSRLIGEERLVFRWKITDSPISSWIDRVLVSFLILALLGAGTTAVYVGIKNIQPYSELYLLGANGKTADYPQEITVGQMGELTLVLTNHEHQSITYTIKINQQAGQAFIDGQEQDEITLTLQNEQEQSYNISFRFDNPGDGQKLEFDLYKGDGSQIYLQTYLKIDVTD